MAQLIFTSALNDAVADDEEIAIHVLDALRRFKAKDWGEVSEEDCGLNEMSLEDGSRLFAIYDLPKHVQSKYRDESIWIILDAKDDDGNRQACTVLWPSDY